jgi:hypothetical protein
MHLFRTPQRVEDGRSIEAIIREMEASAETYWRGQASSQPFIEILAEKLWLWTAFISDGPPPPYCEFNFPT